MSDPRTVTPRTSRPTSAPPSHPGPETRHAGPRDETEIRDKATDPASNNRVLPAIWGVLFLLGGAAIWLSLTPRENADVPEVWTMGADEAAVVSQMGSEIRPGGERQGNLLRLTWPEYPQAESYRVHFRDPGGNGPHPVAVQGTVFLYDMQSNVLRLPNEFEWEVSAVLPDGSEVLTPPRFYSSLRPE